VYGQGCAASVSSVRRRPRVGVQLEGLISFAQMRALGGTQSVAWMMPTGIVALVAVLLVESSPNVGKP
jgi:hypothetical protein